MYTDRVPYLGLVEWDEPQIRAYAEELATAHTPRRRRWIGEGQCRACGTVWPCFAASWSLGMLRHVPDDRPHVDAVVALAAVLVGMAAFVGLVVWL